MSRVDLKDLPEVTVDPDDVRRRLLVSRLHARDTDVFTKPLLAEMSGLSVRTIERALAGGLVSPHVVDRVDRALDGHWTAPNTPTHVEDMRRCLAAFLDRISSRPVEVTS